MTPIVLDQAIELIGQGRPLEARPLLRELVFEEPHNVPAWFWYVETFPSKVERIHMFKQCLAQNPDNPQVKEALDYLEKNIPTSAQNASLLKKNTNHEDNESIYITKSMGFLKKRFDLVFAASVFMMAAVIFRLLFLGDLMPEGSFYLFLIAENILINLSNPFLVGLLHTAYFYRKSSTTGIYGALEGALAAVLMVGIREVVLAGAYIEETITHIIIAFIAGAFAGSVVILWKNKNQKKDNSTNADSNILPANALNNRERMPDKSLHADWADGLYYLSYIFIVLGGIGALMLIYYLEPDIIKQPLPYLYIIISLFIGPFVQALILCVILGYLYRNVLSGAANLLASLLLFMGAAWIIVSIFPSGDFLYIIFTVGLFVGHFLVVCIVIGLGWTIRALNKTVKPSL